MSLFVLPNELILIISTRLDKESDLNNFLRSSHRLYHLLLPSLYAHNIRHNGSTGLIRATKFNQPTAVSHFLALGADLSTDGAYFASRNSRHKSCTGNALYFAVALGHTTIVAQLLFAGADPNTGATRDDSRFNPLSWAVRYQDVMVANLLVAHGAKVRYRAETVWGVEREHSLHRASSTGPPEVVRLLLENGAEVDVRDGEGSTPLHCAVAALKVLPAQFYMLASAEVEENLAVMVVLLEYGATAMARDTKGRTPRGLAARHPNPRVGRLFEEHARGGDIKAYGGLTAIRRVRERTERTLLELSDSWTEKTGVTEGEGEGLDSFD